MGLMSTFPLSAETLSGTDLLSNITIDFNFDLPSF